MNVMGIIFTNDASLGELTHKRTMASLPFGGRYRLVDFALSNLSHAGVHHVGIISRYNYQSLMNHIGDGEEWGLELEEGGLEFLTPYAMSTSHTYRGKLESLANAKDFLEYGEEELVVMIDSSVIYNLDLNKILNAHVASGKDVTVVAKAGICDSKKKMEKSRAIYQSILDNRVRKAGRNIIYSGTFLLCLLYLGIHKYGTTGT